VVKDSKNVRDTKSVVVLGKGTLAIKIARYFCSSRNFSLLGIVPVLPEPKWTDSFSDWGAKQGIKIMNLEQLVLSGVKVDLGFSCHYDKILKSQDLLVFATALNLHNSPLPRYRGVNPINWALRNNEKEHGVTIHSISTGIDDGPIYGQVKFKIDPVTEEVIDVYNRSIHFGYSLFEDVISNLDKISPVEQEDSFSTYFSKGDFEGLGDRKGFTREITK
jgi:methionyl-tRNA formyltransferase